jgi:hypothetical protein
MYRKHHNGQLSIEEFHVPFGGTLDPENRWVLFATLMPSDEIEEAYAPQFSPTTGAPAKPARLAFGALFIKQRLGLRRLWVTSPESVTKVVICSE